MAQLASYGFGSVRMYGVECNAIDYALTALSGTGTNLIAGPYTVDNYTAETADFVNQVGDRWDQITYVTVFNEAVNDGRATVDEVATAISYVKGQVPNGVLVTTVDTFSAYIANSDLCNVGQDFIAANCEPYFSAIAASDAGAYVVEQRAAVATACDTDYVAMTGLSLIVNR
jgi:exo-beta-1,3-glucanase (GH17 family)